MRRAGTGSVVATSSSRRRTSASDACASLAGTLTLMRSSRPFWALANSMMLSISDGPRGERNKASATLVASQSFPKSTCAACDSSRSPVTSSPTCGSGGV